MRLTPRSLRLSLLGRMLLLAVLPLLFAAVAVIAVQWRHENLEARHNTLILARQVKARFENILKGPQTVLSQNHSFLSLVSLKLEELHHVLDAAVGAAEGFESIFLVGPDGRVIAAGAREGNEIAGDMLVGVDLSSAPYYRAVKESGGVVWSDVYQSLFTGRNSITVAMPVGDMLLAGTLSIDTLAEQIRRLNLDPILKVFLADRHGNLIFHPDPEKVAQRISYAALAPVRGAIAGKVASYAFSLDGEAYISGSAPVEGPGWAVVVAERVSDIHAQNRRMALLFAAALALALLAAVTGAVLVSSRIVGPLDSLGRAAATVSRGSYDLEIPAQPYVELETLARGFREMAATVQGREELLSESYERLNEQYVLQETLLDAVPMPVFFIDGTGLFLGCNRAFEDLCGKSRDELSGLSPADLGGVGIPGFVAALFAGEEHPSFDAISTGLVGDPRECRVMDATGKRHTMLWQARAFSGLNDRYQGIVCVLADISVLRDTELRLRHAQKMEAIGTLAGGIAHDFNNVLNAVLGYAELSLLEVEEGSTLAENLSQISAAGRRAADLVRRILTFSRRREGSPVPFLLGPVAKESVKLLKATISPDIEISCEVAPDCPPVLGDVSRGQQLVMNLCTNAVQAMDESGGRLQVELARVEKDEGPRPHEHGWLRLRVADTGPGIPDNMKERIFEPYFSTKERGPGGTGLGLAIVHGIVNDLGGVIEVADNPGGGTVFTVWLPGCDGEKAAAVVGAVIPLMEICRGRVMLVDDEEMLRSFVGRALEMHGCEVEVFASAGAALDAFNKEPDRFDLVITDQVMPKMSGMDLAREVKKARPDLPVVLFTGYSEAVSREDAQACGIDDYKVKPLTITDITAILNRFMEKKG